LALSHEHDVEPRHRKERGGENGFAGKPRALESRKRAPGIFRIGEMQHGRREADRDQREPEQRPAPQRLRRQASGCKRVAERDEREQASPAPELTVKKKMLTAGFI